MLIKVFLRKSNRPVRLLFPTDLWRHTLFLKYYFFCCQKNFSVACFRGFTKVFIALSRAVVLPAFEKRCPTHGLAYTSRQHLSTNGGRALNALFIYISGPIWVQLLISCAKMSDRWIIKKKIAKKENVSCDAWLDSGVQTR